METRELKIPWSTLIKLTAFALLVLSVARLVPLLMLCALAALIAIACEPLVGALEKRMPRLLGIALLMTAMVAALVALAFFVSPPFYDQAGRILQKAPQAGTSLLNHLPEQGGLHRLAEKMLKIVVPSMESWVPRILSLGELALGVLSSLVLLIVLIAYFLIDGRAAWAWLTAFFSAETRAKLDQTATEVTPVVSAYVIGQIITSVLCSLAVYTILKFLNVPAALVLAVLAALFDVLPIIGFILTVVPAALFALTVSPNTALMVFLLFGAYHAVENYVIVPSVYGRKMQVSGLVVLLTILAGVSLGGILGAILILPAVASYPIIEKIWLKKFVGERVVKEHQVIEARDARYIPPKTSPLGSRG